MPDYKEMYLVLFRETTKAIFALRRAQRRTEELYLSDDAADDLIVVECDSETDKKSQQQAKR